MYVCKYEYLKLMLCSTSLKQTYRVIERDTSIEHDGPRPYQLLMPKDNERNSKPIATPIAKYNTVPLNETDRNRWCQLYQGGSSKAALLTVSGVRM